ncbi:hypothetical protein [Serratia nevei]|uniref:hypothetical protein n=1 Tax=Serratia nevei TaxID=2703794 RepID=UPI00313C8FD4
MSTEKLSELSKPVAYTDADELRFHHATSDMWPVPLGFGKDVPLYSQEYVSALKHESAVNWEAAASLNVENQELKKRITELGAKLATPVRLKKVDSSNVPFAGNGFNAAVDYCADAIRAAGFTVEGDG